MFSFSEQCVPNHWTVYNSSRASYLVRYPNQKKTDQNQKIDQKTENSDGWLRHLSFL